MAETKITNIIKPEIFNAYTVEQAIYRSRLYNSGVIQTNADLNTKLQGGGETFNFPFFVSPSGDSDVPAETGNQTVNAITTGKEIVRRQERVKAWGTNALASVLAGANPLTSVAPKVLGYWANEFDKNAIYGMLGLVNDNVANDSSDLVHDISDESGTSAYITDSAILQAMALHKENGVMRGDNVDGEFVAIVMHSNVYFYLQYLDAITFVPISGQARPLEFYHNMQVIVDDNITRASESGGYSYYTFLLKPGAVQYGLSSVNYEPTSFDRIEDRGMGVDVMYTRRVFAMHYPGFAWQEASVAGLSPTYTELAKGANWDRVASSNQLCRFAALLHEIPSAWQK
jgi:hypothetical protein